MIFNNNGNVFEQLANNYIRMIENNVLKEGEYLPSCRDLAKELGINPNTVQKAYTYLEEKGYVTKVLKKGVYVSYKKDNDSNNNIYKEEIRKIKDSGISKEEIIKIIDEVYGGEKND